MFIPIKQTSKSFKIYSLCYQNYMINFIFSSKVGKIADLKRIPGFTNFFSMVIQLYKLLSTYEEPNLFILYIDSFFTNMKLFKYFCQYSISVYRIIKAGFRFLIKILVFWDILTKNKD